MRKVMMMAAMLAMVLAAAAPAFAQAGAVGGDVQIQNQYCPQVITQYANAAQDNTGSGIGAAIAQDLGIDQSAVNACLQAGGDINLGTGTDTVVTGGTDPGTTTTGTASSGTASSSGSTSSGSAAAASGGVLPDTGGASLIALGAGALLVGGGLLARRIVR